MSETKAIIQTDGLTRLFKENRAVDALDLSIQPGELFGLVGPDGAGKTTTLRLLTGLLKISSGSGSLAGFDLATQPEEIKRHIGYMAQEFSLYSELTVLENLRFFAELYDVAAEEFALRSERLLEFAALTPFKDRRADHLSGGMQKKLALACTLIHDPEILILDEPTTGVDPISRREFWDILAELHINGTTVIVSTPYMDEADRCSRVGLMYEGRMVVCDNPEAIRGQLEGEVVQVRSDDWQAARVVLGDLPGILETQSYGEAIHLVVDSAAKRMPEIQLALEEKGVGIREIRPAPPRMEEAFISLIRSFAARENTQDKP
ncbi:MAG: ABC transporter ATP-binding protein [Anaerolineales bacterium]|jgi:ABC-2 type transport system ATP-binding protein|nr:ABC transporter ATP-binding protein [Anaerolineales bacterium]